MSGRILAFAGVGWVAASGVALAACGSPGIELVGDGPVDRGAACTFVVDGPSDGGPVTCRVEPDSLASCADAAECLCRAAVPAAEPVRIDECIGWELTPRAMITLSDFCGGSPAYHDLAEALRGYYGSLGAEDLLTVSEACAAIPALAGDTPYAECVLLAGSYCPCIPGICDADRIVGGRCAGLSRGEVLCIYARVAEDREHACDLDMAAVVAACTGEPSPGEEETG